MLDSDRVVHDLYRRPDVRDAVVDRLGGAVVGADGEIDRAAVAARVFADDELRRWLERLIHPLVARVVEDWVNEARARATPPRALVQEVALLFETGGAGRYDRTLVIAAAPEVRRRRVAARGGMERLDEREARLLPDREKAARADDVIVNDGDLTALDERIAAYLDQLPCSDD